MKKIISLIIITFLLISCSQKKEEEVVTACIDEGTVTEDGTIVYSQDHSGCS